MFWQFNAKARLFSSFPPHRTRPLVLQQYRAQGTSRNLLGLLVETFLTPNLCGEKPTDAVSFIYSGMHCGEKKLCFPHPPLKPSVNLKKNAMLSILVFGPKRKKTNKHNT